jgi:hypothetical protein
MTRHRFFLTIAALTLFVSPLMALENVSFLFAGGMEDLRQKERMEKEISHLLTEVNNAANEGRALFLSNISITPKARKALSNLWQTSMFRCDYDQNVQPCLTAVTGCEVRGIAITMLADNIAGDKQRELVICFNKGAITDVHLALSSNMYQEWMYGSRSITDKRRLTEILSFVERFRSFYNEKDLESLEKIFSEDALIITGNVIKTSKKTKGEKNPNMRVEEKIVYNVQNKQNYLNKLSRIFNSNKQIYLTFDEVKPYPHKSKSNWYGVSLRQNWKSDRYEDDGYVFLLWEFFDDNRPPVIHIRTWQPYMLNNKPLDKDSVFDIDNFLIP